MEEINESNLLEYKSAVIIDRQTIAYWSAVLLQRPDLELGFDFNDGEVSVIFFKVEKPEDKTIIKKRKPVKKYSKKVKGKKKVRRGRK